MPGPTPPSLLNPMNTRPTLEAVPSIEISLGGEGVQVFPLKPDETVVGRNPFCDLLIESGGISRRHARIFKRGNDYYIEDLNSINGTFLNRDRLKQPAVLSDGDTIHFYRVSGTFRLDSATAEGAVPPPRSTPESLESPTPTNVVRRSTTTVEGDSAESETVEQRLHAVLKVVGSLGRSLDIEEVLANILDGLFDVFPQSRRGNIWLIDDEIGKPVLRATKQTGSQTLCSDSLGPLAMGIMDDVISQRKAILSVDEVEDDLSASVFDFHLRSSICAPLPGPHDEVIGAICIDSDDGDSPFNQEDLEVLTSVSAVAGQATEYAQQHERLVKSAIDFAIEKSRRKLAEEKLGVAESVQRTLYPSENPEVSGFDIAGAAHPTEEGCGDYFDFIALPDGRLAIAVGDVSGHGLGAALYMVQTRSYIRAHAAQGLDVAELLGRVNRHLCEDLVEGTFVTLFLAILDPARKELTWSSAGHPGFRIKADREVESVAATNIVLGLVPDAPYQSRRIQLATGDILILPTDGFYEANNDEREMYGHERMLRHVESVRGESSAKIIESLCNACFEFAGDVPIQDDMTCVLIKVL